MEDLNKILAFAKIESYTLHPAESGYRNTSYRISTEEKDLNLIIFKPEPNILPRIRRADAVSLLASNKGLPVRRPIDGKIIQLRPGHLARLYTYLPGHTISWQSYSMNHIKLLGWAMSDLHHALKDAKVPLPDALLEQSALLTHISRYLADPAVTSALTKKLHLSLSPEIYPPLTTTLATTATITPTHPLHLDLVRGNLLFSTTPQKNQTPKTPWTIKNLALTGLIDFEKSARGPALLDLARTHAFLLVDCATKSPEKIQKYLIHSGYNKRGQSHIILNHQTAPLFDHLTTLFLLYDLYKFLRHNPYESLSENHHFTRTRDILLQKKVLRYTS